MVIPVGGNFQVARVAALASALFGESLHMGAVLVEIFADHVPASPCELFVEWRKGSRRR